MPRFVSVDQGVAFSAGTSYHIEAIHLSCNKVYETISFINLWTNWYTWAYVSWLHTSTTLSIRSLPLSNHTAASATGDSWRKLPAVARRVHRAIDRCQLFTKMSLIVFFLKWSSRQKFRNWSIPTRGPPAGSRFLSSSAGASRCTAGGETEGRRTFADVECVSSGPSDRGGFPQVL